MCRPIPTDHMACEIIWTNSKLVEMHITKNKSMNMFYGTWIAMYNPNNPFFHGQTKYVEVDYHFLQDIIMKKQITSQYV